MKVKDLIELLKKQDQNVDVYAFNDRFENYEEINGFYELEIFENTDGEEIFVDQDDDLSDYVEDGEDPKKIYRNTGKALVLS